MMHECARELQDEAHACALHRVKGIYPTRRETEEGIVRLLEREELDIENMIDKIGSPRALITFIS
jgi:hypothetical protein